MTRDEAHRLVDGLDPADVGTAVALLRQLASGAPVRILRGVDLFDGPADLAERSSEILRVGLGATVDDGSAANSA